MDTYTLNLFFIDFENKYKRLISSTINMLSNMSYIYYFNALLSG